MEKIRDQRTLQEAIRVGFRPEYLFFYGHKPLPGGEIGKPCLSQWWPASFIVDGQHYLTAEQYMMAEKARLFGDEGKRMKILDAASPAAAKELGRAVRGFSDSVWERSRIGIVVRGNLAKFSQNPKLSEFLLSTRDCVLVETSPVDRVWGIGLSVDDKRVENPKQWRGLNLLGFALMEVRYLLQGSNP